MIIELEIPATGIENLKACQRKLETIYPAGPSLNEIAGLLIAHVSDEDSETQVAYELEGLIAIPEITETMEVYVEDEAGLRIIKHFQEMSDVLKAVTERAITASDCMAASIALVNPNTFFELYDAVMLTALQE